MLAPLQEMMLQSWDGALRVFPAWPRNLDASFENFRAEGAFLVSAVWSKRHVESLQIFSEKGAPCRLYPPWAEGVKVVEVPGKSVECIKDDYGRLSFQTHPGGQYQVERLKP